jgi:WS/DGAT/MGAT family acyltransferase
MSGLDASFLYTETRSLHMHTLKIGVLDVSDVPGGYSFERFKQVFEDRMDLLPPFRRRVVTVPGNLHHPVWIEDPDFDLWNHVRLAEADAPGGSREFDAVISRIASTPLDHSRPLWETWVVEGLADGRIGFVTKIHHSVADGVAAAALLANVMSTSIGDTEPPPTSGPPWIPDPVPRKRTLVRQALSDHIGQVARLPSLLGRTVGALRRKAKVKKARTDDELPPGVFAGPRTSFNGPLTPNRSFASITLPLADFKTVRAAFDCTVNDVVLTIVAGSLRAYLEGRGEHYDEPLVTAVPLSSDKPDVVRLWGNRTSNMFTALRTDIVDPVERLQAISRVTRTAKQFQNALGVDMMQDWVDYTPPAPYAWVWRRIVPRLKRPPINCIVSNVPGPREPLFIAGGRMTGLYSVGPIMEGVGLNVTVWSYLENMNCSAISCPELLPDLHAVTDGMGDALDELVSAAARSRPNGR